MPNSINTIPLNSNVESRLKDLHIMRRKLNLSHHSQHSCWSFFSAIFYHCFFPTFLLHITTFFLPLCSHQALTYCSTSTLLDKLNYTSPFEIVQFWMLLMLSTWTQSQSWIFSCFNSNFSFSSFPFLFLTSWNTCSFLLTALCSPLTFQLFYSCFFLFFT